MDKKLNIIFMGTSDLAGIILEDLIDSPHKLSAVVTQPDSENKSRKAKIISPVKETAIKNKITVFQPKVLDKDFIDKLKQLNPDLIIVAAYGKILPKEILELPKLKALNVHASLLPKLRGPSPIQNSLFQGDSKTGITIMVMDKGVDTGDILSQKNIKINSDDDYITLTSKLAVAGAKLLLNTIPKWANKEIKSEKQDNNEATLCQLIEKNDGRIFWDKDAISIYNSFRAFRVWPGIFTFWDNNGTTKKISLTIITTGANEDGEKYHLGEIFQRDKDDALGQNKEICIQTSEGVIIVNKLQLEGKNEIEAINFINGYPNFIGSILK
jgi:methionyl-tRNA formyltransferase